MTTDVGRRGSVDGRLVLSIDKGEMTLLVMQVSIVVPNKYQSRNHVSRFNIDPCLRWNDNRCGAKGIGRRKAGVVDRQGGDDPPGHAGLHCCPE